MSTARLQYDLSHTDGSHIEEEFNAPDHINPLVSCVDDRLGYQKQTGNTMHVTLLSVPSEILTWRVKISTWGEEQEL